MVMMNASWIDDTLRTREGRRMFELAFAPLARRLGWRPEFPWARLVDGAARHGGVSLTERRPMPPMGHFSLIRYRKA